MPRVAHSGRSRIDHAMQDWRPGDLARRVRFVETGLLTRRYRSGPTIPVC